MLTILIYQYFLNILNNFIELNLAVKFQSNGDFENSKESNKQTSKISKNFILKLNFIITHDPY